jgi:regulatory protein
MALALKALGHKERTERELTEWLQKRGVGEPELEDVVSRLIASGGLDDGSFAARFAEDKRQLAGWGPERIREALEGRGVAPEQIDSALAGEDEASLLGRAVAALSNRGMACESEAARARALAFLARRGYPLETAYDAVRRREAAAA